VGYVAPVRRFSADYLERTRAGLWESTAALEELSLGDRTLVVDVGCGSGEFTRVLAAESDARVVGVDADTDLLSVARTRVGDADFLAGDATRLPVRSDAADLVVCQALLVNLPDPPRAVAEFARVSSDLVAAVEPDNAAVAVDSTVAAESSLAETLRSAYLDGVETDVALGDRVSGLFSDAGLRDVRTRRHYHEKRTEPPYDEGDLEGVKRKVTGEAFDRHERELRRVLSDREFEDLRRDWRAMGREAAEQMREGAYARVEVVPFDVTVGRV
jgi:SAM-dependent methyltransferase